MELNFEQAFSYMKADRHLAKKLAVGGILPWLCMFLFAIPIIVAYVVKDVALTIGTLGATLFVILLVALVMNGFVVQTINNRIHNKEEVLPDWGDFGIWL